MGHGHAIVPATAAMDTCGEPAEDLARRCAQDLAPLADDDRHGDEQEGAEK